MSSLKAILMAFSALAIPLSGTIAQPYRPASVTVEVLPPIDLVVDEHGPVVQLNLRVSDNSEHLGNIVQWAEVTAENDRGGVINIPWGAPVGITQIPILYDDILPTVFTERAIPTCFPTLPGWVPIFFNDSRSGLNVGIYQRRNHRTVERAVVIFASGYTCASRNGQDGRFQVLLAGQVLWRFADIRRQLHGPASIGLVSQIDETRNLTFASIAIDPATIAGWQVAARRRR